MKDECSQMLRNLKGLIMIKPYDSTETNLNAFIWHKKKWFILEKKWNKITRKNNNNKKRNLVNIVDKSRDNKIVENRQGTQVKNLSSVRR